MRTIKFAFLFSLFPTILYAQQTANSFDTSISAALVYTSPRHVSIADKTSTGLVIASFALPCFDTRTVTCVKRQAERTLTAVAIVEATKRIVHRTRPDDSDRKSFFSGHTTVACIGGFSSKQEILGAAVCATTAYLRIAAGRHWFTDTLTGAVFAYSLSRAIR